MESMAARSVLRPDALLGFSEFTVPDNPGVPLPARALIILIVLFFVVPGLCCVGCLTGASYLRTPAETPPQLPVPRAAGKR
jgi:hypothetical protein